VPDSHIAGKRIQIAFLEDTGDEAEILGDRHGLSIAYRDTRTLLPTVLQRVKTEVGQARHILPGSEDAKDAARFFGVFRSIGE
jgi:hypothetical protein